MSEYWNNRIQANFEKVQGKTEKQIMRQIQKYYKESAKKVIEDFQSVYSKIMLAMEEGKEPTPADLYKLDKYWTAQAKMKKELEKLGNKEIKTLSEAFETNFFEIYYGLALPADAAFNELDTEAVNQLINAVWVSDGLDWSKRVWKNTERLAETLNEQLIHICTTGKSDKELIAALQDRFGVSYSRAESLVRTEVAHIQTEAAKQRYKDAGIQWVEVLVDPDEKTCDKCKALIGKKFPVNGVMPLPVHPNERCCLVPVID